jgi:hypothetical protein
MDLEASIKEGPYLFFPLHGFGSNKDVLELSAGVQICSYDEGRLELLLDPWKRVRDYLAVHPAEYLIQARPPNLNVSVLLGEHSEESAEFPMSVRFCKEWFKFSLATIATVPYCIAVSKLRRPFLSDFFITVRLLKRRETHRA